MNRVCDRCEKDFGTLERLVSHQLFGSCNRQPAVKTAATPEPPPKKNDYPAVADIVASDILMGPYENGIAKDILARKAFGMAKYGTALQPFNGRDMVNDLYQEVLDGSKYALAAFMEESLKVKAEGVEDTEKIVVLGEVYEVLLKVLNVVYCLKNGNPNGAPTEEGCEAGGQGSSPQP